MNKGYIFILFCSLYSFCNGQMVVVHPDAYNFFYAGIENSFEVAAENCSCNSLVLKTSNGAITGKGCQYEYYINYDSLIINEIHRTEIKVYRNANNKLKLLATYPYIILKLPDPVVHLLRAHDSKVYKNSLSSWKLNNGHPRVPDIVAEIPFSAFTDNLNVHFIVDSFHFSIFRQDSCLYNSILNKGNFFTEETYKAFEIISKDDTIVFDKIYVRGNDGSKRLVSSFSLKVIDQ